MLGKLFKYEMRATGRTFLWLYIAFAAISIVNAVFGPGAVATLNVTAGGDAAQVIAPAQNLVPEVLHGVIVLLYSLAVVAIVIVTFVVVILRFYRSLLGNEGYLMMTLPVSREQHMLSKFSAAMVWTICSAALVFGSILLMIASMDGFPAIAEGINEMIRMGVPVGRFAFFLVILLLASSASGILMLYAAMSVGPNLLKNRVGGSILAYILIYIAFTIVAFAVLAGVGSALIGPGVLAGGTGIHGYMTANFVDNISTFAIVGLACHVAYAAGCWFLTRFMLRRKLNLA